MENKLIPMTTFVQMQLDTRQSSSEFKEVIKNYNQFLKQPLELWMFVPCDEEGNVLSEPQMIEKRIGFDELEIDYDYAEVEVYKKAKERVLFEGFEWHEFYAKDKFQLDGYVIMGVNTFSVYPFPNKSEYTVENLVSLNPTLTETAIKSIYGS